MHLHCVFRPNPFVDQKCLHILSVFSLQLDNQPFLRIVYNCAVAREFLLKCLEQLLHIDIIWDAFYESESLASRSLLVSDVNRRHWE